MNNKSLSIILPLYNEEENIRQTVYSVLNFFTDKLRTFEIILVNDGSTDRTGMIIDQFAANNKYIQPIHHAINRGYGAAFTSGLRKARYETIVFMDADGQFDIAETERLLFYSDDYDIIVGYRIKRRDSFYRVTLGMLYSRLVSLFFGLSLKDINCGFKVFKKSIFEKINILSTGALVHAEIFIKAKKMDCSVKELGLNHFPRKNGKQKGLNLGVIMRGLCEIRNVFER